MLQSILNRVLYHSQHVSRIASDVLPQYSVLATRSLCSTNDKNDNVQKKTPKDKTSPPITMVDSQGNY